MKVYLEKDSWGEQTREPYSDDDWDRGDSQTEWSFGKLSKTGTYDFFSTVKDYNVGDKLYVVVAVWSTGDSFGYDSGACSEVMAIYEDQDTANQTKDILEATESREYTGAKVSLPGGYELSYCPWSGYFEGLDYIQVLERTLVE